MDPIGTYWSSTAWEPRETHAISFGLQQGGEVAGLTHRCDKGSISHVSATAEDGLELKQVYS